MSLPLRFEQPWLNAACSLGFAPDVYGPVSLEAMGAFVTNPISLRPRWAANPPRVRAHPDGLALHSGHPNPGFSAALRTFRAKWARAPLPIVVHLLADNPVDVRRMLPRLEELENMLAVEVGLPPDSDAGLAADLLRAALGELPVIGCVAANRALELAPLITESGASAVSLGAPRAEEETFSGRLYGPQLFESTLNITRELAAEGIATIAGGGVYRAEQARTLLEAGALAVQLDTVLWRGRMIKTGNW